MSRLIEAPPPAIPLAVNCNSPASTSVSALGTRDRHTTVSTARRWEAFLANGVAVSGEARTWLLQSTDCVALHLRIRILHDSGRADGAKPTPRRILLSSRQVAAVRRRFSCTPDAVLTPITAPIPEQITAFCVLFAKSQSNNSTSTSIARFTHLLCPFLDEALIDDVIKRCDFGESSEHTICTALVLICLCWVDVASEGEMLAFFSAVALRGGIAVPSARSELDEVPSGVPSSAVEVDRAVELLATLRRRSHQRFASGRERDEIPIQRERPKSACLPTVSQGDVSGQRSVHVKRRRERPSTALALPDRAKKAAMACHTSTVEVQPLPEWCRLPEKVITYRRKPGLAAVGGIYTVGYREH